MDWFKKEVEKYQGKIVNYHQETCKIQAVFWNDTDERLEFYLESQESKKSYRIFEKDIIFN